MMFKFKKTLRFIALFLAINILVESVAPSVAHALTSGPTQPEFSSFEPVATTNMVDPFTGSFTYNLPVINVPGSNGAGYGISLSYHTGDGMEDESTWVGHGWSLNPGAINRNKSGFPDDVKGGLVTYQNQVPANYTVVASESVSFEGFGGDAAKTTSIAAMTSISASTSRSFNSYKGFGRTTSIGVGAFNGIASLNYTVGNGESSFNADINPAAALSFFQKKSTTAATESYVKTKSGRKLVRNWDRSKAEKLGAGGSSYGIQSLNEISRPTTIEEYDAFSIAIDVTGGATPGPVPLGVEAGVSGNYSRQKPDKKSKFVYGSMHLSEAANNKDRMMDCFVEKESYYNKRDLMLSIPYNATDAYTVMGEGIAGGFKYKNTQVGQYFPTPLSSQTVLYNGSVEFTLGTNVKPLTGLGLAVGVHELSTNKGYGEGNYVEYQYSNPVSAGREDGYFRFNGDLSNYISYSSGANDTYTSAKVSMRPSKYTNISSTVLHEYETIPNETQRAYRSSYIGYTTYEDFNKVETSNNYHLRSYTRDNYTRDLIAKSLPVEVPYEFMKSQVAEMYSVSEDGSTYVYGLPVLAYNETTGSKLLDVVHGGYVDMSDTTLYNSLRNGSVDLQDDYNVSETHAYPYATSYLLTQIQTVDYIDRTFDGPTSDDLGGWTKFNYAPGQPYSSTSTPATDYRGNFNWYGWRAPYKGYEYSRGTLSHTIDDMLHYSEGKKQQYYLQTIETKTHVAFFVTNLTDITVKNEKGEDVHIQGSQKARIDAASALMGDGTSPTAKSQMSQKLERIILFAKNDKSTTASIIVSGKPLKIANFEYYGYSTNGLAPSSTEINKALCKGVPNRLLNTTDNPFGQGGKLTLKRVWFEYEGVINAKIAPYEFYYEYKSNWNLTTDLQTKYNNIVSYASAFTSIDQNPNYNPNNLDAWGDYMQNGVAKKVKLNNSVEQNPAANFDPAAWQLKRIVLPSGGEILVQYEQADYNLVHDQIATVLTPLKANTSPAENGDTDKPYYLDLASLGITTQEDIDLLFPIITDYLTKHKIYFKFLYSLNGNTANISDCNIEYITGYALATAGKDANGIYIKFVTPSGEKYTLPSQVCKDFFKKERNGLFLTVNCNNDNRIPVKQAQNESKDGVMPSIMAVIAMPGSDETNTCRTISIPDSYLKIPVLYSKKGGGIRVKRVMMYDPGLETGDQMLYGSEYIYKLADNKTSSGVATNEPLQMREENALIDFLKKRSNQTRLKKITSGIDKEQFEGPIGEGLLPAPSIGYSRVVVKNIHTGKTNTGFTVQEFHTAAEHPIRIWGGDKSTAEIGDSKPEYAPGIFVNHESDKRYSTQGYAFVLYDIHGKPKRVATYKGDYDQTSSLNQELNSYKSYEEIYQYTQPGEQVKVLDYNGNIRSIPMGRDEEIAMEMRSVSDITNDYSMKVDFSLGYFFIPLPFGTMMVNVGDDEKELNTHVINKVIRYTPVLKRQILFKDGVTDITEHKVFSISNGKPLITVHYDGYNGLDLQQDHTHKGTITNYAIPADYIYKDLSGKFKNEKLSYSLSGTVITEINSSTHIYQLTIPDDKYNMGYCAIGDLIKISNGSNSSCCYVTGLDKQSSGYTMTIQALPNTSLNSAMVGTALTLGIFVLHSGFENQLDSYVASATTYGEDISAIESPLILSGGQNKLRSFSNAINVSAQTYTGARNYSSLDALYGIQLEDNEYLAGRTGKFRPFESYTQKKAITPSSATTTSRVYSGGTFTSDVFDFTAGATNSLWTKTNTVTMYSPDGNPLEEKNILNVYSTAQMGYGGTVPVLVAKNSAYSTAYFNGFEEYSSGTQMGFRYYEFPIYGTVTKGIAHTGTQSLLVPVNSVINYPVYNNGTVSDFKLDVNNQLVNKGIMTRMWVKVSDADYARGVTKNFTVTAANATKNTNFTLTEISRVGEWSLVEGVIPKNTVQYAQGTGGGFTIQINNISSNLLYIDDVRMQPYDAEMACYVYDPKNLRLVASFDDQHFALFYQYNAEGKLLRKLVETEKGVKTITESQFNTPIKTY